MLHRKEISQIRVHELLDCIGSTSELVWRTGRRAGQVAGYFDTGSGRFRIGIDGCTYFRSRIVFLHVHGFLPDFVDHFDRDRTNDRIENLRAATASENAQNACVTKANKSTGVRGVYVYFYHAKPYRAYLMRDGKQFQASFASFEEAVIQRLEWEKCWHPYAPKAISVPEIFQD